MYELYSKPHDNDELADIIEGYINMLMYEVRMILRDKGFHDIKGRKIELYSEMLFAGLTSLGEYILQYIVHNFMLPFYTIILGFISLGAGAYTVSHITAAKIIEEKINQFSTQISNTIRSLLDV